MVWHWVNCRSEGNSLGICGNSWIRFCINSAGDCCVHALIYRRTQDTRQLCSVWEPGQGICAAFPSRCQSQQPSFDSLTFQFYPPQPPRQLCLPESCPFLSFPCLSLLSYPQSLFLILLFSACLEEQSQSRQSLHFVTSLRMGSSLTLWHVRWEIFLCTPIRSACRPVAGRSSILQHGVPNLCQCLSATPYLHLFLCVFLCFFLPPFFFLSSTICHCLSDINFIYFSLACCLLLLHCFFLTY